jgi:hypothetical protein
MDFIKFNSFLDENPEYKAQYERLTDEDKQQLYEAAKNVEKIAYRLLAYIRVYVEQATKIYKTTISRYPNKRVVYLALCSKKERIRKKNMHRIIKNMLKIYKREGIYYGQRTVKKRVT